MLTADLGCDVDVVSRGTTAKAIFRGDGGAPFKAALQAMGKHKGFCFAEVKEHNGCDRQRLERLAANDGNDDDAPNLQPRRSPPAAEHRRESGPQQPAVPQPPAAQQPHAAQNPAPVAQPPARRPPWRDPDGEWCTALGGAAPLAFGRPLIHDSMKTAEAQCAKEKNSRQKGDWRTWAYDLPARGGAGAPKRYVAATVDDVGLALDRLRQPSCYEIIDAAKPCWAYFDLEFYRGNDANADVDGDALTLKVIDAASRLLVAGAAAALKRAAADGRPRKLGIEVVQLDASRETKFSRHVLFRPFVVCANGARQPRAWAPLRGSAQAKVLAQLVCDALGETLAVAPETASKPTSFVDLGVYTAARCFRLVGSTKLGSTASGLRIHSRHLVEAKAAPPGDDAPGSAGFDVIAAVGPFEATELRETLVVPQLPPDFDFGCCIEVQAAGAVASAPGAAPGRPGGADEDAAAPKPTAPAKPGAPADAWAWDDVRKGVTDTPLLDISDVAHPFIRCIEKGVGAPPWPFDALGKHAASVAAAFPKGRPNAKVFLWKYICADFPAERLVSCTLDGPDHCFSASRAHKSNKTIVVFDLVGKRAWQKCWDKQDCSRVVAPFECGH
ncbi:hypothetical protein M885DRAFT_498251 [Pelagophyceae sp. CCMP2097]|nr:hypothetical protein M885DRAFT_498251 [Pelagophyceae sp. CCMP2097]